MRRLIPLLLLLISASSGAQSAFPANHFTPPEKLQIHTSELLIVTHASTFWDTWATARAGVAEAADFARGRESMTSVFLQKNEHPELYYDEHSGLFGLEDQHPDYFVSSDSGEFSFSFDSAVVYLAGGFFDACQLATVRDVLKNWSSPAFGDRDLTLSYYPKGIYQYAQYAALYEPDDKLIPEGSPYLPEIEKFQKVFGSNRFTLEQLFRIIGKRDQISIYLQHYLAAVLKKYPFPDRQIELWLNGDGSDYNGDDPNYGDTPLFVRKPLIETASPRTLRFIFLPGDRALD